MSPHSILSSSFCLLSIILLAVGIGNAQETANPDPSLDSARLNQVQVIGTHNSYHIAATPPVMQALRARSEKLAMSLDYTHCPLADQFSMFGVRQIELDIFADPKGGLYAEPSALRTIAGAGALPAPVSEMQKPGLKILHVQDIDYRTTEPTLVSALRTIRSWLKAHPQSYPIMVMLELKQSSIGPEFTQPHPFGPEELDSIDREILSVFRPTEIIKPDDVRGDHETLRQAVLKSGWPRLSEVRGKVIFAMDNGGELPEAYLKGHPSLRDRLLFVSVAEDHPAAAFLKLNDPFGQFERIQQAVKQNFIVRTRADSGTVESRTNDSQKRDKALASGAQYISTDYPEPDKRFSQYHVALPGDRIARRNPVSGQHLPELEFDPVGKQRPAAAP